MKESPAFTVLSRQVNAGNPGDAVEFHFLEAFDAAPAREEAFG